MISEYDKINAAQPERNYTSVKGKDNFRMDHFSRRIKEPPRELLTEYHQDFLDKFEAEFTQKVLMPTKFPKMGKTKIQVLLDEFSREIEGGSWRGNNTVQNRAFGMPGKFQKGR